MRRTHMVADCVEYRYLCFSHLHVHVMLKSFNLFWDPLGWSWLRGFEGMGTLYHGPQRPSQGKKQKKHISIPWVCTKTLQQKEQVPSTPARIRMSHVIWFQCSKTFWVPFVASKNGWRQMIHPIQLRPKLVKLNKGLINHLRARTTRSRRFRRFSIDFDVTNAPQIKRHLGLRTTGQLFPTTQQENYCD